MRSIALLLLASALLFAAAPAQAAETRFVTVTGEGSVAAAPDIAEASAGVTTRARTASAALAGNEKAAAGRRPSACCS